MSWEDIAEQLGISDTRVMQLHDRAIHRIRKQITHDPSLLADFAEYMGLTPDRLATVLQLNEGQRSKMMLNINGELVIKGYEVDEGEPVVIKRGRGMSKHMRRSYTSKTIHVRDKLNEI